VTDAKIFVDYREKGSGAMKQLIEQGLNIELKQLKVGDYVLSHQCGVEFKTVEDFVESLVDGRLLQQVRDMVQNFAKPLIIVEGSRDIYSVRNIHPNAIRGLLATITVSYGVPVLFTKNHQETAGMIAMIAKREQETQRSEFSLHAGRKPMSAREQQEYVVSALPGVGMGLAKQMLERFGSVEGVINATEEELKGVELIGDKKAKEIKRVVAGKY
jgi:Fanconi anemia group M protein